MIGDLQIPLLLSLAALVSNFSVLLLTLGKNFPILITIRFVSIVLILGNSFLIGTFLSGSEREAYVYFHLFRSVIFFIPYLFLKVTYNLTARKQNSRLLQIALLLTIFYVLIINIDYLRSESLLISGWNRNPWGFWPILHLRAKIFIGIGFFIPFLISLYLLLNPKETLEKENLNFSFLLVVWWIGFSCNFLALFGVNVFPFGMAIDTIISVLFSLLLTRYWRSHFFVLAIEFFSVLSCTILCFILIHWAMDFNFSIRYFGSFIIGMVFVFFLFHFFQFMKSKNSNPFLWNRDIDLKNGTFQFEFDTTKLKQKLNYYDVTKKEIQIAEMITRGFSKKQIRFYLDITDGTFRNHLSNLYAKTIDLESPQTTGDKFQRLIYFLTK
ncbi:helix-turn-helix transcriptional regulator [Leptospira biflexa]|uniref:helix-turn-helix transcriptional regulator n=1 Tax=Leptospira biflexa TaxID=172 RepID=UPI0010845A2E|nr:LuxR C-terminal-related transcriptional regulator [Leptospira biflexa]TGM34803.1 DNA-binding response regulator [Leptospira biflexa]TGM42304.1 DNA-binding response regulator [Leptospira biflexa]